MTFLSSMMSQTVSFLLVFSSISDNRNANKRLVKSRHSFSVQSRKKSFIVIRFAIGEEEEEEEKLTTFSLIFDFVVFLLKKRKTNETCETKQA